ncbi:3-keto-disaccharide hydrolase [Hyunsoonleella aestuarii]|uniref:DUF1080 domain-containing protein n=1 Tax=Hyunsoonleella aestuarii TaxID=912802 RepID=A0ABP8E8D1_9FLAO|nr:DUF1080 domain-containing protein [Hyunsoonleella aestuarii]
MGLIKRLLILTLLIGFVSNCKKTDKKNTKTDTIKTEITENWQSLFNGENLDGWLVKINGFELNDNYNNTFRVENGILKVSYDNYESFTNEFGHIFYKTPFTNYKLRLEYRFVGHQVNGGEAWAIKNSGIMLHSQSPESMRKNQGFPLSLEFQLLGGINENETRPSGNICTPGTHVEINGSLITEHCIPANCKTYYGEEWIMAEVVVNNDSITHYIDGVPVISYSNPTIGGQYLDDSSEDIQTKAGQSLTGGYVSLQSESHPIEFRNIEILEF